MQCDICGKKAIRQVIFNTKFGNQLIPQKFFYCCDSDKCLKRLEDYAKERNEVITIKTYNLKRK